MSTIISPLTETDVWSEDKPRTRAEVETAFRGRRYQINQALQELVKEKDPATKLSLLAELTAALHALLAGVENFREEAVVGRPFCAAAPEACERLARQLEYFAREVRAWCVVVLSTQDTTTQENTRAKYAAMGAWAMHFSVIRVTVTTFFMTASWGVVSVKWDSYDPALCGGVWGAWFMALIFLLIFTRATSDASAQQSEFRRELPSLGGSLAPSKDWTKRFQIEGPVVLFVLMTAGFAYLTYRWSQHPPSVPMTALVSDESTEDGNSPSGMVAVDLGRVNETMERIDRALEAIRKGAEPGGAARQTASPSPTP